MILITCTNETKPADFLLLAQNPTTYELMGFSATGTEYAGDFVGFECRVGTSNELGTYDHTDPENPVLTTNNTTVREQFNAWQDVKRMEQYRKRVDHLAAESQRKSVDSRVSAAEAQLVHDALVAETDAIKAEYPKV